MSAPFSAARLPGFVAGTTDLIALPRDTEYACVEAPSAGVLFVPKHGIRTGSTFVELTQLELGTGDLHLMITADGQCIRAVDAALGRWGTYAVTNKDLDPLTDPRAAYLYGMWLQARQSPRVILVRRSAPITVLGQLPEESDAVHQRFGGEGAPYSTLTPGCYVVRGAQGTAEVVSEDTMRRLFASLAEPGGTLVRKLAPPE